MISILLAALLAEPPRAARGVPVPLRWVYDRSELVVLAKAGETVLLPRRPLDWHYGKVVLTVDQTLKGKCDGAEIPVLYCPTQSCPAPASFPRGQTLLVFLNWDPNRNAYLVTADSYGTKGLVEAELAQYALRTEELSKLAPQKEDEGPSAEIVEWLVRCIEHPATRWDGAYDFLLANGEMMRSAQKVPLVHRLSLAQFARIENALVSSADFGDGDSEVVEIFDGIANPRIDIYLATRLKCQYARGETRWSGPVMDALADRLNLPEGKKLREDYRETKDLDAELDLIGRFLGLLDRK
jgi:hypothetical protein